MVFCNSWDLRRLRPNFLPRGASVVFGTRIEISHHTTNNNATWSGRKMPDDVQIWTGRLKTANATWPEASAWITRKAGKVQHVGQLTKSPYAPAFTQGAIFAPRVAFVVEQQKASSLGLSSGKI